MWGHSDILYPLGVQFSSAVDSAQGKKVKPSQASFFEMLVILDLQLFIYAYLCIYTSAYFKHNSWLIWLTVVIGKEIIISLFLLYVWNQLKKEDKNINFITEMAAEKQVLNVQQ